LRQAVHPLANFDEDETIFVDEAGQIVLVNEAYMDLHILGSVKRCIEVEVPNVPHDILGIGGGYGVIDMQFESCLVGGWGAHFARIFDAVTINC
jgi:hypothetical protein